MLDASFFIWLYVKLCFAKASPINWGRLITVTKLLPCLADISSTATLKYLRLIYVRIGAMLFFYLLLFAHLTQNCTQSYRVCRAVWCSVSAEFGPNWLCCAILLSMCVAHIHFLLAGVVSVLRLWLPSLMQRRPYKVCKPWLVARQTLGSNFAQDGCYMLCYTLYAHQMPIVKVGLRTLAMYIKISGT